MKTENTMNELIEQFEGFQREFQTRARAEISKMFEKFWELNPGINAVVWTQYAPYFNDGAPCTFSVKDCVFTNAIEPEDLDQIRWEDYDGEKEDIWACTHWGLKYLENAANRLNVEDLDLLRRPEGINKGSMAALSKMLCNSAFEGPMLGMFGDDNRVIATRDGFQVEDYSGNHD
jgi:hypothetical protein